MKIKTFTLSQQDPSLAEKLLHVSVSLPVKQGQECSFPSWVVCHLLILRSQSTSQT